MSALFLVVTSTKLATTMLAMTPITVPLSLPRPLPFSVAIATLVFAPTAAVVAAVSMPTGSLAAAA